MGAQLPEGERDRGAMLRWLGCDGHVKAVRWTYARVAEVWSGDASLSHGSRSAWRWDGDLRLAEPAAIEENGRRL